MTTTERAPAALTVDFDVYDPSLAAPVDVMQDRIAELAAKGPVVYSTAHGGHWSHRPTSAGSFRWNSTRRSTPRIGTPCNRCSARSG